MSETEVKAKIGFEVDDKPLEKLQKGIESLKEGLFGLTATLIESGVALYETVVKTSEAGEAAIKLGQQTGVGTVEIQRLQFAAKMLGLQAEDLTTGLKFLNRNMFQAATGGGALADIFTKTGVSIRTSNGQLRPANQVLGDIAEKFKAMPDGAEKSGLAMKFFGKQGVALIPVLNKGRDGIKELGDEAESLGAILSEDDAEKGKEFQESLKLLSAALVGIRNIVASDLMPAFTEIVHGISAWIKQNRQLIQSGLGGFLKATVSYLMMVFHAFTAIANSLMGFANIVGGVENAVTILLVTMGVLAGASILYGLGTMATAIYGIATAFTVADAAALLIPIGIGLAIIALGLVIEDLYQFATGGDSVFGRILAYIAPLIAGFRSIGVVLLDFLLFPLRAAISLFGDLLKLVSKIPGFGGLAAANAPLQNLAINTLDPDNFLPGQSSKIGGGADGGNNSVNVNAPITVTVPPNTPPGLVGDRVSEGVSNGVENHLRQAQRATSTSVAY